MSLMLNKNRFYILLPIISVLLGVLFVGFLFSIHVAKEYESHNHRIRMIESVNSLASIAHDNHASLLTEDTAEVGFAQVITKDSLLYDVVSALTIDMGTVLLAIRFDDSVYMHSRGYLESDFENFSSIVKSGSIKDLQEAYGSDQHYIDQISFGTNFPSELTVVSSIEPAPFILDFVINKLWIFLLGVLFISMFIALVAYHFAQNRYDEVLFERTRLSDFATSSSDWFWEMDRDLRFSYFSSRFTKVTGVPTSLLLGVTREENGNPGASPEDWIRHLDDLKTRRPFKNFIHPRTKPDGRVVWLSINGTPVFENGKFLGYRGTGSDITRQREMENQLTALKEEAERANMSKSEFLANMSHELRTPLNAVVGYSDALKREMFGSLGSERNTDALAMIHQAGTHLAELINDILDISRIETGSIEIQEDEVSLANIVAEVIVMVQRNAKDRQISIETDLPADLPLLLADRLRLKQVLLNLLNNAVKFTPNGGRICVSSAIDINGDLSLEVTDTGIGVRDEDIPLILEPFGQVANAMSREHGGAGLGLPICRSLIELHGGELAFESDFGKGSRVRATFPAARVIPERLRAHLAS